MHISPYENGNIYNKDPLRDRKLLLKKREIYHLLGLIKQQSCSLIPISLYLKNNKIKVELGSGKGQDIAKKDAERKIDRAMKNSINL